MANKAKYALGGAMSGAAAGAAAGPWGMAIGALAGGLLGASQAPGETEKQKMLDQALIDKLANQALGNEATASELNLRQAFDKTLAQQISAARTQSRGVNPALQSRNIARMASEKASEAAAESAKLAVSERANSFNKYMQAIQYNNGVLAANQGTEAAAEKGANMALANGLNAGANAAVNYAVKRDTLAQQATDTAAKATPTPVQGSTEAAQTQNAAYNMGAQPVATSQPMQNPFGMQAQPDAMAMSDKYSKQSMKVVSDERQKDLIKSEDLPQNGNMQMQNMQAQQPQAAEPTGTPIAPPAAAAAQGAQAAATGAASAPAASNFTVSPEMIAKAQASMRQGGNVSDIRNAAMPTGAPSAGITPEQDAKLRADAEREAARQNTWDNRVAGKNKSANDLYEEYLAGFNTDNASQIADFNAQKDRIAAINTAKDLERSARLSNFYTGVSTTTPQDVAQGYASEKIAGKGPALSGDVQQAGSKDWLRLVDEAARPDKYLGTAMGINPNSVAGQLLDPGKTIGGDVGNFISNPISSISNLFSDERTKTSKKSEGKKGSEPNMSPKSFLDKLEAYSYEYKPEMKDDPRAGEGRKLGVMAQDLEKAGPVGQQMVEVDPQTGMKQVNYGQGFGAILASQVQLNERLKELEAKYGKKMKGS